MPRAKGTWTGENNCRWTGGRYTAATGYVFIHNPAHPNADKRGYVREHVLIMSTHLGRPIAKDEVVHHINGVRDDNRLENLQAMKRGIHHSLHHKGVHKPRSEANLKAMTSEWQSRIWQESRQHQLASPKVCDKCGTEFYRRGKPRHDRLYCSRACYFADRDFHGEANPAYKHGRYVKGLS